MVSIIVVMGWNIAYIYFLRQSRLIHQYLVTLFLNNYI